MKPALLIGGIAAIGAIAVAMTGGGDSEHGLKPGERVTPFNPTHIVGPLAGTTNCFPCTFQKRPQVQVWINGDSQANVDAIAKDLQKAMDQHKGSEFKALIVYVAPKDKHAEIAKMIKSKAERTGKDAVDMAVIDPGNDALDAYKIALSKGVKNTVYVYKDWEVKQTMVNFKADSKGLDSLNAAIGKIAK